jgi:hypothetical protein
MPRSALGEARRTRCREISGTVTVRDYWLKQPLYLWREEFEDLSDIIRVVAIDLLAHGDMEITPEQDVSQQRMS